MNSARLLELADTIENGRPDLGFNMQWTLHEGYSCGTSGCIAGWAAVHTEGLNRTLQYDRIYSIANNAQAWLELTTNERSQMFCPPGYDRGEWNDPADAVATLRHAAYTGKIVWDKALKLSYEKQAVEVAEMVDA